MKSPISQDWLDAADVDTTLADTHRLGDVLSQRELQPTRFSRRKLFIAMARQKTVLFSGCPITKPLNSHLPDDDQLKARLKKQLGSNRLVSTVRGKAQIKKRMRIKDVVDLWDEGMHKLAANDIYFRGTALDEEFDFSPICDFNLLCEQPGDVSDLEIATVLLGSKGCMMDSHSDDPDGCNHCIRGRKLWLAWDRREGEKCGLEDCTHDDVYDVAKFNLEAFAKMKSSIWFTVSDGQTLFMPGHLTHKVITLKKYIGVSSFYLSLPNALASLARWKIFDSEYVGPRLWARMLDVVLECARGLND